MKASRSQIERALGAADPAVRLFLFHGPDEAGSAELAQRLGRAVGADAERIDLTGATLRADPARLADEAAAMSLFGARRWIRVDPAGDEVLDAVTALLEAPAAGNPVALIAGALRKDARLLKRLLDDPAALVFASYAPEGVEADRLAIAMARDHGLDLRPDVAQRLAAACGGDRALLARELEKFADYLDAAPERPKALDHDALDLLGADSGDADIGRLVDAVLGGAPAAADEERARLAGEGVDAVPLVRALQRRLLMLAEARAGGTAPRTAIWKDRDAVAAQLARWETAGLAIALARVGAAGRATMAPGGPGALALDAALTDIARAAARRR